MMASSTASTGIHSGHVSHSGGVWEENDSEMSPSLACVKTVRFGSFKIGSPLGFGRQGTTFHGIWNGQQIALKLFDTTKPGGSEAFEQEIEGYKHLSSTWGVLIPAPYFVCFAFGVAFLGMQLAESPKAGSHPEEWYSVVEELEEKFRFRHLDVFTGDRDEMRNLMVLRREDGSEQKVVIDLEEYELLP